MLKAEHFRALRWRGFGEGTVHVLLGSAGIAVKGCRPGAVASGHETEGLHRAFPKGFTEEMVQCSTLVSTEAMQRCEPAQLAQVYRKADHMELIHAACLSGIIRPSTTLRVPP